MKPSILILVLLLAVFSVMLWYNGEHPFFVFDNSAAGVLLTASAVVLTGTAVAIAVAGWFGYKEIKAAAILAATEVAEKISRDVAQETARSMATRTLREAPKAEMTAKDANQMAESYVEDDSP